jgi:hypothetical protein
LLLGHDNDSTPDSWRQLSAELEFSTDTHDYFCLRSRTRFFANRLIFMDVTAACRENGSAMQSDTKPRLSEIAEILAAGLMRLMARKSSPISAEPGESSLDLSAAESGHPIPVERRISDG